MRKLYIHKSYYFENYENAWLLNGKEGIVYLETTALRSNYVEGNIYRVTGPLESRVFVVDESHMIATVRQINNSEYYAHYDLAVREAETEIEAAILLSQPRLSVSADKPPNTNNQYET